MFIVLLVFRATCGLLERPFQCLVCVQKKNILNYGALFMGRAWFDVGGEKEKRRVAKLEALGWLKWPQWRKRKWG